jgi:Cysteine-rich secretory protein family
VGLLFRLVVLGAVLPAACKKEDPPASYPQGAQPVVYPTTAVPTATSVPAPAPAPVTGAAAVGLPCATEQDLQCAFSHCINNRCGGCQSNAACKPGSQCLPTFLGYACFPGAAQSAPASVPAPPVAAPPVASNPADPLDALRARCVQRSNEFRARVSLGPLGRQTDREACLDTEAQADAKSGTAHGAFGRCQESAQNECPGWPGPLDQVIDKCLAQMFAEGPGPFAGHGHYINMTDPKFRSVSCGFSTAPNGQIWLVQDFYR